MQHVIVTKRLNSYNQPWWFEYTITGWGNPAGEVYDLKNGQFLALANSCSTGYARKVFKTSKGAERWIERRLRSELSTCELSFEVSL